MKSVNQEIANLLDRSLSIQKSLQRGIINIRSLAKFLIEEYRLKYSLDAVISAIRRYDVEEAPFISSEKTEEIFSAMSISTKDHVARIMVKDKAFKEICEDFLGKKVLKDNVRLIKSKETITLLVNQKDLEKKLKLFKSNDIIRVEKDLSELRLQFHEDIRDVKGIIARVAVELAIQNISIVEVIYSIPDLLVYVQENSVVNAHKALREIKR